MRPLHEGPIDDIWRILCKPLDEHPDLWTRLRLDVARFLDLQRRLAVSGAASPRSASTHAL